MVKGFFRKLGKGLFAGVVGAVVGIVVAVFYLLVIWVPTNTVDVGLAVIVLLPVLVVLFSVFGAIAGGILGLVFYWAWRVFGKK